MSFTKPSSFTNLPKLPFPAFTLAIILFSPENVVSADFKVNCSPSKVVFIDSIDFLASPSLICFEISETLDKRLVISSLLVSIFFNMADRLDIL